MNAVVEPRPIAGLLMSASKPATLLILAVVGDRMSESVANRY